MRLLHVIPYYRPSLAFGGPVTVCSKLAEAMVQRGHSVQVVTTDAASRTERYPELEAVIDGVHVVRVRNASQRAVAANLYTPLHARSTLSRLIAAADVVHVHDFWNWLSYRGATLAAAQHKPVLLSGHASLSFSEERGRVPIKQVWMRLFGTSTIAAASAVQATMAYEAEQCLAAGVPREKIRIVPQGVAAPPRRGDGVGFRAKYGLGTRPIVLFAGRLRASKGVDLLLEAAGKLSAHPARPWFVVVGAAENRPDLAPTGASPRGNVLLTGALSEAELQDAYAAASMLTLPSYAESMPLVVLDALAFGLPVVLSHACNLAEVAQAGAGVLVDNQVESLRAALQGLLDRPDTWAEMGARGQALVRERYSSERVHAQYEHVYKELLRG